MSDLFRVELSRFDLATGLKVLAGLIAVFGLTAVTDQPWMATGLVVLFGWMTDLPGKLEYRLFGVVAFGVGAALITLVADALGTGAPADTVLILVVGLLGSLLLANGTRPYMVGYVLICWAIYGPALATETSVGNVLLAIFVGTAILVAIICAFAWLKSQPDDQIPDEAPGHSFLIPR